MSNSPGETGPRPEVLTQGEIQYQETWLVPLWGRSLLRDLNGRREIVYHPLDGNIDRGVTM